MVAITVETDTLLTIYNINQYTGIGSSSLFATVEHPGTNNKIEGWKWDKRTWPTKQEFEATNYVPTLWDPETTLESSIYIQSGYGDNNDLLLKDIVVTNTSGLDIWTPKVEHGRFFIHDELWFLYNDYYISQYFTTSNVISGYQYLDMKMQYKPSIPIQVRRYYYNQFLGRHFVETDFRKKVDFTEGGTDPEFQVDLDYSPPRIWLNGEYNTLIGTVSGVSLDDDGKPLADDIRLLEQVGISDGSDNQEFYLQYSPLDPTADIEIWAWKGNPNTAEYYNTISGVESWPTASGANVRLDRDRGILNFGDYDPVELTGFGKVPAKGHKIGAYYTASQCLMYEPKYTSDQMLALTADVHPLHNFAQRGFVQILTQPSEAYQIVLTAELNVLSSNLYKIFTGNSTGRLTATVTDTGGRPVESEDVTFNILAPVVGSFGASNTTTTAKTNTSGKARTIFNAPLTIDDLGQVTDFLIDDGSASTLIVSGVMNPSTVSGLYLYKIAMYDPPLGIPVSGLQQYYTDYLASSGVHATTGSTANQTWESIHREMFDLGIPTTYDEGDLTTGKKTICLTSGKTNIVNPHTGNFDITAFSPLYATTITDVGTTEIPALQITYSGVSLPTIGYADNVKSYFVVGNAKTRIQASVTNQRTKKIIYSNIINLQVTIPDSANGTYYADLLSEVVSGVMQNPIDVNDISDAAITATQYLLTNNEDYEKERLILNKTPPTFTFESYIDWFRRTKVYAAESLAANGFNPIVILVVSGIQNQGGELPLGFRLRSTGITLASLLDQITYIDPNPIV